MISAIKISEIFFAPVKWKLLLLLSLCIAGLNLISTVQDYLESIRNSSSFYLSESLLFGSFWWIFLFFLPAQFYYLSNKVISGRMLLPVIILVPALLHIFLFPGLVWLISLIFYSNTFGYSQTLGFELSEHLYILVLLYTAPISFSYFKKENEGSKVSAFKETFGDHDIPIVQDIPATQVIPATQEVPFFREFSAKQKDSTSREVLLLREMIVSEGRKTSIIRLSEVYYFSANPPYIYIHLANKKLLHNETLKSISGKLDNMEFVRIHKSTIVNLSQVQNYHSRLNGDYDLVLKDGTNLRISRNYAPAFKEKISK